MRIYSDASPNEDILAREPFARQIASGLIRTSSVETNGFVTALTGKWGSGKTTLLTFLKKEIEKQCAEENIAYMIIEFNPWMFADKDNIRLAFLKQFASSLSGPRPLWKRILAKSDRLKHLEVAHRGLGSLGTEIGSLIKSYIDTDNALLLKKKINELLVKANKKIFVFIDDIDRLYPKQVFEILQVLKLTGNFKNTFYVIAYDREAVELSIESQFKDYGKKYLDKIVQADFLIPEASDEKIENIFFDGLEKLCKEYNINYNSSSFSSVWLHRGIKQYFSTLRDVYRYLNSLQFSLPVIADDVDITDFLVLEAVRLHDFETYLRIYEEFIGSTYLYGTTVNFSSEENLKKIRNNTTQKLIQFLFPAQTIGGLRNTINKRLYDPKNFQKYFTLQISTKDISEIEFRRFMEASNNRFDFLKTVMDLGRLDNLIIRLRDEDLFKQYNDWKFDLISEVFRFLNIYSDRISQPHRIADAIINLLHQKKKEQNIYFNHFLDLLLASTQEVDSARIYFYHFMLQSKGSDNGFPNRAYDFKEFYLNRYDQLKNYYLGYLTNWENYFLGNNIPKPFSYYTLLFIFDYATYYIESYKQHLSDLLNNPKNLLFFLKNILLISTDGEAARIESGTLNKLLPEKQQRIQFFENVKNMDITPLTEEQIKWREFVLEHHNEIV